MSYKIVRLSHGGREVEIPATADGAVGDALWDGAINRLARLTGEDVDILHREVEVFDSDGNRMEVKRYPGMVHLF